MASNSLADHSPLGKILTDRAGGSNVTAVMTVGRYDAVIAYPPEATSVERVWGTTFRYNDRLVQSQQIVKLLAKQREPAYHHGEKPR